MTRISLVLLVLLAHSHSAWAQSSDVDLSRSQGKAFALSFLGTVVPFAAGKLIAGNPASGTEIQSLVGGSLAGCGLIFGPGLGHVYAGNYGAVGLGATIRTTGLACAVIAQLLSDNFQTSGKASTLDDALAAAGGVMLMGGVILDWVRAPALLNKQKQAANAAQVHAVELRPTLSGLSLLIHVG